MTSHDLSPRLRALHSTLSRARAELPALLPVLDAFGPLLAAQAELYEAAPGWSGPLPGLDPERFSQGAFILSDGGFEDMSAQLPAAAKSLLPLMAACFPALAAELSALAAALDSGALSPLDLAAAAFGASPDVPGASPTVVAFAAAELARPFLRKQGQSLLALIQDLPWSQHFCPVCGGAPSMSVLRRVDEDNEYIKSHGGRRYMRCSCCAAEWTHKRVSCPACDCEDPNELPILRVADREHERADACDRCKTFVLCLDTGELAEAPDPDVSALTMLPLETKATEQGYTPLARHPWSGL